MERLHSKTAIRFLRKHHEEYFIDEQNVFLFGDSSGGHVALVSGLTSKLPLFNGNLYSEYSNEVRAIIDLGDIAYESVLWAYYYGGNFNDWGVCFKGI